MRRLLVLIGAVILVDTVFYAAIAPLLPEYEERFGLGKTGAGVLAGSYAAGAVLGTWPSGWLATRFGARRTVVTGLMLLSVSSVGFAFSDSIVALDATRFVQGLGAACSWAGGMGWLIAAAPAERRGETIGRAMVALLAGTLLGPVVGSIAHQTGPELPFTAIGALAALLTVAALRMEAPPLGVRTERPFGVALGDPRVRAGALLVLVPGLVYGAIEVLAPLELDRLGASGLAIGATFLAAAAIEGVVQILVGRLSDRRGRGAPIRAGLVGSVACLVLLPLPGAVVVLAAVVVVACVLTGVITTPSMALLADGIERLRLDQSVGFALVNLVWATGLLGGSIAGGALAGATSDAVTYLGLAAICALALVGVVHTGRGTPQPDYAAAS